MQQNKTSWRQKEKSQSKSKQKHNLPLRKPKPLRDLKQLNPLKNQKTTKKKPISTINQNRTKAGNNRRRKTDNLMRWVSERSEIYGKLEWKNYTFANQIKGIHEGRLHEIKGVEEEEKQWREKAKQSFNFYFLGIGARNYLSISMVLLSQLSVIFPLLCSFSFFPFSLFFLSFFFFLKGS